MKHFAIRRFSGIETNYDGVDQDRGTLRMAIGVAPTPVGTLSTGPVWSGVWGQNIRTSAINKLTEVGATDNKTHFLTVSRGLDTFLVAFHFGGAGGGVFKGIWHVNTSTTTKGFGSSSSVVVAAPGGIYADKVSYAQWFGTWIGNRLLLGNGHDANLVWQDGALYEFGPSAGGSGDINNPSQARFPPCTSFIRDNNGILYAAGNQTSNGVRIWMSERPTAQYPSVDGIKSAEWSYLDIHGMRGSTITALSMSGSQVVAHLGNRGVVAIDAYAGEGSSDGWKGSQRPMAAAAGAVNPDCVRDTSGNPFYLGTDGEVYNPQSNGRAYDQKERRDSQIATNRSAGSWNSHITRPIGGEDGIPSTDRRAFAAYDANNGRLWFWAYSATLNGNVLYCYDQRAFSITGPFLYPLFQCACVCRDNSSCVVVGITASGHLRFADMSYVQGFLQVNYAGDMPSKYYSSDGFGSFTRYVGRTDSGKEFTVVHDSGISQSIRVWAPDPASGDPFTRFNNECHLCLFELNPEDMGEPDTFKEFVQVRLHWQRNTVAEVGVFAEADGRRAGKWRWQAYPREEQVCGIGISGRRLKLRIALIVPTDRTAILHGLTIDWLPASPS
ncbi:MAG: hypothetical protein Q8M02_13110 [Candidatus Didemnitutus sp.]|nr:hypothetical protein [Candidatus Didemnitutus sp.]